MPQTNRVTIQFDIPSNASDDEIARRIRIFANAVASQDSVFIRDEDGTIVGQMEII